MQRLSSVKLFIVCSACLACSTLFADKVHAQACGSIPPAGNVPLPPPGYAITQEPEIVPLPPYVPAGLSDPRLRREKFYAPGTKLFDLALKSLYEYELNRYAKKLIEQKDFEGVLKTLDLSIKKNDRRNADGLRLRAGANMELAGLSKSKAAARPHYRLALNCFTQLLKDESRESDQIGKLKALIGLGLKQQATTYCLELFQLAQLQKRDTAIISGYLLQLTGKTKPTTEVSAPVAQKQSTEVTNVPNSAAPTVAPTAKENYPPTLEDHLEKIDKAIARGSLKDVVYWSDVAISWESIPPSQRCDDALRPRLVQFAERQNKSKIASFLREAPFSLIFAQMGQFKNQERNDFSTTEEYAALRFYLRGGYHPGSGVNCEIGAAGHHFPRFDIMHDTPAARNLFAALKIPIPFDVTDGAQQITTPPLRLLTDVEESERTAMMQDYLNRDKSHDLPN